MKEKNLLLIYIARGISMNEKKITLVQNKLLNICYSSKIKILTLNLSPNKNRKS